MVVSLVVENFAELKSCNRFFGCRFDKIKLQFENVSFRFVSDVFLSKKLVL